MNSERLEAALQAHRGVAMKLVPPTPPGRSTRKARAFALQMRELRAQGYTFESIRQALAAVGVHVSNATVQRELARVTPPRAAALPSAVARLIWAGGAPGERSAAEPLTGKEIAEAFTSQHISNPLLRAKLTAKDDR